MTKYFAALFLSLFALTANAQTKKIDSLKKVLLTTTEDTTKALLLSKLGGQYYYSKPDTSMLLARQAMLLSKKIKFLRGEALSFNLQGIVLINIGNYPKSLSAFLSALKINEKRTDHAEVARNLSNLGNVAAAQGDLRQSVNYTMKALVLAKSLHDDLQIMSAYGNIGDSYEKMNMLDSARIYTQQGFEMALKLKNEANQAITTNNMGNIYAKMKNPNLALNYYRTALPLFKVSDNDEGYCESTIGMARIFKQLGQRDSSLYYARLTMVTARAVGFTLRMFEASKFLTGYYEEQGQVDSAFHYQKLSVEANESLFSQEKTKEGQNLVFEENQRQQEIALQKLEDEEHTKENLQLAGIAVFIPAFFLFVLFLSRRKTKPRTVEFLGILSLLMVFEFVTLLLHPHIEELTHHTPALSLLILVCVAALLVPFHHKAEHWVKSKLLHQADHKHKAE
jgi:tetratricopeptide (TPR) repeat protein